MFDEESTAVLFREDSREPPRRRGQRANVEQIDDHQIARLRAVHTERPAEIVHLGQVDVANVVRAVVILDLPTRPVVALDPEFLAWLEPLEDGNVGVPPVMGFYLLLLRPFVELGTKRSLCHERLLSCEATRPLRVATARGMLGKACDR